MAIRYLGSNHIRQLLRFLYRPSSGISNGMKTVYYIYRESMAAHMQESLWIIEDSMVWLKDDCIWSHCKVSECSDHGTRMQDGELHCKQLGWCDCSVLWSVIDWIHFRDKLVENWVNLTSNWCTVISMASSLYEKKKKKKKKKIFLGTWMSNICIYCECDYTHMYILVV